jgi:transposase
MWDILPRTLYHWYRNHLCDYHDDKSQCKWPQSSIVKIDATTGEVLENKPVYIFKPNNLGEKMSIDDKNIGGEGYTILSNTQTGKIAMMVESVKKNELESAVALFGRNLLKIRSISLDMSATYLSVCREQMPDAEIVIDKFHVMQYLYDAVLQVRSRIKNELAENLTKGKEKTEEDKKILYQIELLNRCRYRLMQSSDKWSETGKENMHLVFTNHIELKVIYNLSQDFKKWYDKGNCSKNKTEIKEELYNWYKRVIEIDIKEMKSVVKMIRKHENEIINYFSGGHTSAKAERINGKIKRFISANFGVKDRDFVLYRIAGYFS